MACRAACLPRAQRHRPENASAPGGFAECASVCRSILRPVAMPCNCPACRAAEGDPCAYKRSQELLRKLGGSRSVAFEAVVSLKQALEDPAVESFQSEMLGCHDLIEALVHFLRDRVADARTAANGKEKNWKVKNGF